MSNRTLFCSDINPLTIKKLMTELQNNYNRDPITKQKHLKHIAEVLHHKREGPKSLKKAFRQRSEFPFLIDSKKCMVFLCSPNLVSEFLWHVD